MNPITNLIPQFFDTDGQPLDAGYLYFGTANLNPETDPITVYWDSAGTQPAAQPIRTVNGYPSRYGTPGVLYLASSYSFALRNKKGLLVATYQSFVASSVSAAMSPVVGAATLPLALTAMGAAASGANADITSMTGNLTGIKFAAAQVPSADVNTLDDYEEGTWTPVITAQTGSIVSYTAAGSYTKIGRLVVLQVNITITNAGTAGLAGQISNLPFSVAGTPAAAYGAGRDQTGGKMLNYWAVSSTVINVSNYDNTTALLTAANLVGSIAYYAP
jgi:hypothetical protein